MHLECFDCVAGARRREPAGGGAAGKAALIPADSSHEAPCHRAQLSGVSVVVVVPAIDRMRVINRSTSTCSSANDRSAAAGLAPMSNKPAGRTWALAASSARRRRRRRLRVTAGPTVRPMAYATWGVATRGSGTNVHHRTPARAREPFRAKRSKEDRPRTRPIKPTDGGGPWPDGPSAPRGRHEWPCGRGSRASSHAASCWVERCASTQTSSAGSTGLRERHGN